MRSVARLALAAVVLIAACRKNNPKRWVLTDGAVMMSYPSVDRDDRIAAMVRPGDAVELLDEREFWSRVRTENGKEGWIQNPWLVSATAVPAVALEPCECYRDEYSGTPTSKLITPGQLVFIERVREGQRSRVVGGDEQCAWTNERGLSTEGDDVETAKLVHRARKADSWKEIEELLQRARTLHPGARAQLLVAAAAIALGPPQAPPEYEPPPLAQGDVPVSKEGAWECNQSDGELSDRRLRVPDESPGPLVTAPRFEVYPVQTDGRAYALVPPRLPIQWDPLLTPYYSQRAPFDYSARVALPEGEAAGRWYLATRHGVFAAKPALLGFRVRARKPGAVEVLSKDLFLRPAPGGGAGFAFWSPGPLRFRGCGAIFRDSRSSRPERGLRSKGWGPESGKLAILLGNEAATRRTQIERAWAPIHSGYKLEIVPGGEFLFVALEDTSYVAYNVEPKSCRPALLLRWADLSEVARVECPRWP